MNAMTDIIAKWWLKVFRKFYSHRRKEVTAQSYGKKFVIVSMPLITTEPLKKMAFSLVSSKDANRPNPSSKNSHFQNEAKCKNKIPFTRVGTNFWTFRLHGTRRACKFLNGKKWPTNHDNVVFEPVSSIMLWLAVLWLPGWVGSSAKLAKILTISLSMVEATIHIQKLDSAQMSIP